jgi:hypothetical protein
MADSNDVHSSSGNTKKHKARGPTMMTCIAKARQTGIKMQLEFDPKTYACIGVGKNAAYFRSYVGLLARSKCSILIDCWNDKTLAPIKEAIWDDIKVF